MNALAERARAIAAKARDVMGARPTKPIPDHLVGVDDMPPPQTPRDRWTVHCWGGHVVDVLVLPAQTQKGMRELYPDAGGIVAVEA